MKYEMKLLIHSQTLTVELLKFGNCEVIASDTLLGMWLLIDAGIQVNPWACFFPLGAKSAYFGWVACSTVLNDPSTVMLLEKP